MGGSGKVDSASLRQINRSVLLDLIRSTDTISRSELSRRSGLTKPTVSLIIAELIRDGVVRQLGFAGTVPAGGRPARLLEFNSASAAYVGVEFGVDDTQVAVSDGRGAIRTVLREPRSHSDPRAAIAALPALVSKALKAAKVPRTRLRAVGVTVPGLIDQTSGRCRLAPNLGWEDFPLRSAVERALKRPVVVANITQAAAIAEGRLGAAQGVDSFIWLYLGGGVGSGIVVNGRSFTGTRGFAGEVGHCRISDADVRCGCGKRGHLEAFASKMAVLAAATRAGRDHPESQLSREVPLRDLTPLFQAALGGDAIARAVLDELGENVAKGVAFLVDVLDPQLIVVGGSVGTSAPFLLEHLEAALPRYALSSDGVRFVRSRLTGAPLIGAVLLAMDLSVPSYRVVAGRGTDHLPQERAPAVRMAALQGR
jgi:N-acetylglucosamine repressor